MVKLTNYLHLSWLSTISISIILCTACSRHIKGKCCTMVPLPPNPEPVYDSTCSYANTIFNKMREDPSKYNDMGKSYEGFVFFKQAENNTVEIKMGGPSYYSRKLYSYYYIPSEFEFYPTSKQNEYTAKKIEEITSFVKGMSEDNLSITGYKFIGKEEGHCDVDIYGNGKIFTLSDVKEDISFVPVAYGNDISTSDSSQEVIAKFTNEKCNKFWKQNNFIDIMSSLFSREISSDCDGKYNLWVTLNFEDKKSNDGDTTSSYMDRPLRNIYFVRCIKAVQEE